MSSKSLDRVFGKVQKLPSGASTNFDIFRLFMDDDGTFPNNLYQPLLLYKNAWKGNEQEARRAITKGNHWTSPWAWGVFPYHHYHSKAWEILVCIQGEANVQMGGSTGPTVLVEKGDVVYVPPGFAHKQLDDRNGFTLLGAYPTESLAGGDSIDTLTGKPTPAERDNIAHCVVPLDTLCGTCIGDLARF
ncbi:unnamed protein product [Cylindrotheca closterium]|uniref:Cupin type-1 domain-containing protein n=1 Tax=Cylindrotheca closterium TaxID=2856 RepID=A0AAD2FQY7_9STRA|nr:unnamed protein product [Cylindrotheca closterium]